MKRMGTIGLAGLVAVAALATAPFGMARGGADDPPGDDSRTELSRGGDDSGGDRSRAGDVRIAGRCTGRSTAKLKLSDEDGGVEVEFEVDENRVGTLWNVTATSAGRRVISRTARTKAPSGSFEVRTVIRAGSPSTRVTAVARQRRTGEVCRATATL